MNTPISKPKVLLPVAALILIAAGVWYTQMSKGPESTTSTPTATPSSALPTATSNTTDTSAGTTTETPGSYVDYQAGIIEQTSGTKVLFFHAPWCPQCRALETSIKSGAIPANTTIIKVDYDSNQELRKTYGVTLQTTLVRIDDSGKLVKKYVAYEDPTLESLIRNVL